jgi:phage tail sheath protein FI
MAAVSGLISYQLQDADKEITSLDIPFSTSTGLLADIVAFIGTLTPAVDLITDGAIRKIRVSISVPIPGTPKANANAGAENERTGLFQLSASGTSNSYGLDVPAFKASDFTANMVTLSQTDVASFTALLTATTNNTQITDRYGNPITAVKRATKTFRKHRKALRRA